MKTQKKNLLSFKKTSIIELSSEALVKILAGGGGDGPPSHRPDWLDWLAGHQEL